MSLKIIESDNSGNVMPQAHHFKHQFSLHKNEDEIIEEYRILALVPADPKIGPKMY